MRKSTSALRISNRVGKYTIQLAQSVKHQPVKNYG